MAHERVRDVTRLQHQLVRRLRVRVVPLPQRQVFANRVLRDDGDLLEHLHQGGFDVNLRRPEAQSGLAAEDGKLGSRGRLRRLLAPDNRPERAPLDARLKRGKASLNRASRDVRCDRGDLHPLRDVVHDVRPVRHTELAAGAGDE